MRLKRLLGMTLLIFTAELMPVVGLPQTRFIPIGPVIVNVRRADGQLEYRIEEKEYSKRDLNFTLAELKLRSVTPRRVMVLLDESTYLSDIKLVPKMAVDAGFIDIQVYCVFPKSGNMAEVLFGPVRKISSNPDSH